MKSNNIQPPLPHIGAMLRKHIKKHRLFRSALARILGRGDSVVLRYEKRESLQCSLLWKLSLALKHNFFRDLAAQLPPEFTTNAPNSTLPFIERIKILEAENNSLQSKLAMLKEIMGK